MEIFKNLGKNDYEQLSFFHDKDSGLKAIVCIHNSTLGPALGGCRYWTYESEEAAIKDVLRLARGMTYKNAACGAFLGGAKAVIMKDPDHPLDEEALRAFGRFVEGLNGRYITAEDVGTTEKIMDYIYQETDYVVGTGIRPGTSGNPSPSTGHGVYMGMKAAAKKAFGTDSLKGKTVLLEGPGNVGLTVAKKLLDEGATVIASDIFEAPMKRAKEIGCQTVERDKLFETKADIYCPCALGATINTESIAKLKEAGIKLVAGAANNQLEDEDIHGKMLEEAGILYAPDFIINAGGVIHVADELNGGFNKERARKSVEKIYDQVEKVFEIAERENVPTYLAANILAEERIAAMLKTKRIFLQNPKSIINR